MKNLKTKAKVFLVAALMVTTIITFTANAAEIYRELIAQERKDVTVTLNGTPRTLTDASGTVIYPVMINGSTYLPVRAVSEMANLPVEWNQATKTVALGTKTTGPKYLFEQQLKGTKYQQKISDPSLLTVNTADGQQTFKNGISHNIWNNSMSASEYTRMANFDVTGAKTITLTAYSPERDAEIIISGEKASDIISSFVIKKGSIVTKTYNLDGRQQISFAINGTEFGGDKVDAYIFDANIQ